MGKLLGYSTRQFESYEGFNEAESHQTSQHQVRHLFINGKSFRHRTRAKTRLCDFSVTLHRGPVTASAAFDVLLLNTH